MMRRSTLFCVLAAAALAAQASDGLELAAKSRSSASISTKSASVPAPFVSGAADPAVEVMLRSEPQAVDPRGACERATLEVCYDAAERRIVYRPARQYMPKFEGLTPESVSVRHDRVVFKYSFR